MHDKHDRIMDILDKTQFFMGQRAGRELWGDKPTEVQNCDIAQFNRDINAIREYIMQLVANVERLANSANLHWISVEERLPEHMDDVLTWVGGLVEVGCYDETNECWELYTYVGDGSVTHWMHLPEPPKEAP